MNQPNPSEIQRLDFYGDELLLVAEDNQPHVVLKPAVESLGLDYWSQVEKLRSRSWAVTRQSPVTAADGKTYQMLTCDVRTFLMLLATIDERRVAKDVQPKLIVYQAEVADAIEAYWTKGGTINPQATEAQLDQIITRATSQAKVLAALKGVCSPEWLDAHGRIVGARALGIEPDLDPATRPLTVDEFLEERGLPAGVRAQIRSTFGKRLAALYRKRHGREPAKGDRNIGGRVTQVNAYSERDRALFDEVWTALAVNSR